MPTVRKISGFVQNEWVTTKTRLSNIKSPIETVYIWQMEELLLSDFLTASAELGNSVKRRTPMG